MQKATSSFTDIIMSVITKKEMAMPRPERLYELIAILRTGEIHKGAHLAARFGVSLRTIYRDMDILAKSGLPISGEPGTGYRITKMITLPPLNLSKAELEALEAGLAFCAQLKDDQIADAAHSLGAKIAGALSENPRDAPNGWGFATYPFSETFRALAHVERLRKAIRVRQKCKVILRGDEKGKGHILRPLGLDYWGRIWTLKAWCETHDKHTTFRLDKVDAVFLLNALFVDEPDIACPS